MNMSDGAARTYVCGVVPEITANCKHWYSNDFDGLNGDDSILLADVLQVEIDSGRTEEYARLWHSEHKLTLSELFLLCKGTGTLPERGAGDPTNNGIVCNICNGDGHHRQWVEGVQDFVYFLRYCGGFEIW